MSRISFDSFSSTCYSSGSRGGEGAWPLQPGPVKTSDKKDGRQSQRRPHRFHVSCPLPTRPLDPMLSQLYVCLDPRSHKDDNYRPCSEASEGYDFTSICQSNLGGGVVDNIKG